MAHATGPQASTKWQVLLAGTPGEMIVEAAAYSHEPAAQDGTAHQVHPAGGMLLTTFRDGNGEIVFQAPAQSIAYIRRSP